MIWFWIIWSAVGLVMSAGVHLSTYLGVDPQASVPGIWILHMAIFPPFVAAIVHAGRDQERVRKAAPQWLDVMTGVLSAYAIVNFLVFLLMMPGSPAQENGRYYLHSHGKHIRDISEAEFHKYQARIARGFSGHWMMFYSAAGLLLAGARRMRERGEVVSREEVEAKAAAQHEKTKAVVESAPAAAGMAALAGLVGSVYAILSDEVVLQGMAFVGLIPLAVLQYRRYRWRMERGDESFESLIGCLGVIPAFLLAMTLQTALSRTIYVAIYHGPGLAVSGALRVVYEEDAVRLSTGEQVAHYGVLHALYLLFGIPALLFAMGGMTYLAETVGRWIEVRRRRSPE